MIVGDEAGGTTTVIWKVDMIFKLKIFFLYFLITNNISSFAFISDLIHTYIVTDMTRKKGSLNTDFTFVDARSSGPFQFDYL